MLQLLAAPAAFLLGVALGPPWLAYLKRKGVVSVDVYKGRRDVPRAGGLIAMAAGVFGLLLLSLSDNKLWYVVAVVLLIGLVGLLDDIIDVNEAVRVIVPLLAAVGLYFAVKLHMTLPLMGTFYSPSWLAVLAIPVMTNAYNMLDPVNGFLPLSNAIIAASLTIGALIRGNVEAAYAFSVHIAASMALFLYNRYPAKAFNGNVGSYFLGAEIATLAAVYDMVAQLVFASMPYIVNGILIVFSAGGIRGRNRITRPTVLVNGKVRQNCGSNVVSLVRLLVGDKPMGEYEIFKALVYLTAITSALAVII